MDKEGTYRANAADAQTQADRSTNPDDKAAWLRLVEGWLSLLPKRARTASESFDDETRAKGTGQQISKESQ